MGMHIFVHRSLCNQHAISPKQQKVSQLSIAQLVHLKKDPHWSVFIRISLLDVFGQSSHSLPFLAKLYCAWNFFMQSMGRCTSVHKCILKHRNITDTCSITPTSSASEKALSCLSQAILPPFFSSQLLQSEHFCQAISFFSAEIVCLFFLPCFKELH